MITKTEVIKALEDIVEGNEDYKYQPPEGIAGCVYSNPDGSPSCIVGHVFSKLTPEFFSDFAANEYHVAVDDETGQDVLTADELGVRSLFSEYALPGTFALEAQLILTKAQDDQDTGVAWGDVLKTIKGE